MSLDSASGEQLTLEEVFQLYRDDKLEDFIEAGEVVLQQGYKSLLATIRLMIMMANCTADPADTAYYYHEANRLLIHLDRNVKSKDEHEIRYREGLRMDLFQIQDAICEQLHIESGEDDQAWYDEEFGEALDHEDERGIKHGSSTVDFSEVVSEDEEAMERKVRDPLYSLIAHLTSIQDVLTSLPIMTKIMVTMPSQRGHGN